MGSFFGCPRSSAGRIEVRALGGFSGAVWAASAHMSSYCPVTDRDLKEIGVVDCHRPAGSPFGEASAVLVGGSFEQAVEMVARDDLHVLFLGARAEPALVLGQMLGAGRVSALGLTDYSREQRDELRRTQRLLPLHEVPLDTALKCARDESVGPVLVSMNLNVFSEVVCPEAQSANHRGVGPAELFSALGGFPGDRVAALHLWGGKQDMVHGGRSSRLSAETLRNTILTWWG